MKTHVEFRSDKFPPAEAEAEIAEAGVYGQRLAEYLRAELTRSGFDVLGLVEEDWGWVIRLRNDTFPVWVGCGHYEEYPNGFLCFVVPSKPTIRRFLKRIDTRPVVARIATALDEILRADADVTDIKWWSDREPSG